MLFNFFSEQVEALGNTTQTGPLVFPQFVLVQSCWSCPAVCFYSKVQQEPGAVYWVRAACKLLKSVSRFNILTNAVIDFPVNWSELERRRLWQRKGPRHPTSM